MFLTACTIVVELILVQICHSHPHPRKSTTQIQKILKNMSTLANQHRKDAYIDKGIGTSLDSYSAFNKSEMVKYFWTQSFNDERSARLSLRDLAGILIMHGTISRSEHLRLLQFSDMFIVTLDSKNKGPTRCPVLGFHSRQSKTNQSGRAEVKAMMRHKLVDECPVGAIALWMFHMWEVEKRPPRNTMVNSDWYDMHFYKSSKACRGG